MSIQHSDIDHTGIPGVGGSTTAVDGQQGANVAVSATTYTNIVSVSLPAGTWDIWGWLQTNGLVSPGIQYAQLWDGSAQLSQHAEHTNQNLQQQVATFAGGIVLGSTTTIYLRCYSDGATTAYGSTALGTGGGSKIHARKR